MSSGPSPTLPLLSGSEFAPAPAPRTLDYDAGPLVWIDLEMTGLNTKTDKIMEIAVYLCSSHLYHCRDAVLIILFFSLGVNNRWEFGASRQRNAICNQS